MSARNSIGYIRDQHFDAEHFMTGKFPDGSKLNLTLRVYRTERQWTDGYQFASVVFLHDHDPSLSGWTTGGGYNKVNASSSLAIYRALKAIVPEPVASVIGRKLESYGPEHLPELLTEQGFVIDFYHKANA